MIIELVSNFSSRMNTLVDSCRSLSRKWRESVTCMYVSIVRSLKCIFIMYSVNCFSVIWLNGLIGSVFKQLIWSNLFNIWHGKINDSSISTSAIEKKRPFLTSDVWFCMPTSNSFAANLLISDHLFYPLTLSNESFISLKSKDQLPLDPDSMNASSESI